MMKQVEWSDQVTRVLTKKLHNLTETPLRGAKRFAYWFAISFSYFLLGVAIIYASALILWALSLPWLVHRFDPRGLMAPAIISAVAAVLFLCGYLFFSRQAQEFKFPKPDGPKLDEI